MMTKDTMPDRAASSGAAEASPGATSGSSKICIVTNEFEGLHKNGGIGTANTGLALTLAAAGFEVTILYCNSVDFASSDIAQLRRRYGALGIAFEFLSACPALALPFSGAAQASYAVYLHLRQREFGTIYFHDNCGRGYYSLLAKRMGCYPAAPLMLVVAHGPHEWVNELNSTLFHNRDQITYAFLERRSVEHADVLISPSRYMVSWMTKKKWLLPNIIFINQNLLPNYCDDRLDIRPGSAGVAQRGFREIVFFGRMETRKGLILFFDAIEILHARGLLGEVGITFLGKFDRVDGLHSGILVHERSRRWGVPVTLLVKKDQREALEYLQGTGRLAVIPSLCENSPCVVLECLQLGIPFVATDSGGTAELIAAADVPRCLTKPEPQALADRLEAALAQVQAPANCAVDTAVTTEKWLRFQARVPHLQIGGARQDAVFGDLPEDGTSPVVSICVVDTTGESEGSPGFASFITQNNVSIEILFADCSAVEGTDVGTAEISHEVRGILLRKFRFPGMTIASARNRLAKSARGRFLLFVDAPDVILLPGCVEQLVRAANRSGAKVLSAVGLKVSAESCPITPNDGELANFPIGPSLELGAIANVFGDCLAFVDRSVAENIGFPEGADHVVGFWHFFLASAIKGIASELYPDAIYCLRDRELPRLGKSVTVEAARAALDLIDAQDLRSFRRLLESHLDVEGEQRDRFQRRLGRLPGHVRELATRIGWHPPSSHHAHELFLKYLIETGSYREALEFAFNNNIANNSQISWAIHETHFAFEWRSESAWVVEVELVQALNYGHAQLVEAHLDHRDLSVELNAGAGGDYASFKIVGPAQPMATGCVRLRIGIPAVRRSGQDAPELSSAFRAIAVRSVDSTGVGAASVFETDVSLPMTQHQANDWPDASLGRETAAQDDRSVSLDEFYRSESYKHLDLSVRPHCADGYVWPHIKFKFCVMPGQAHIEFREMRGWPVIFLKFPGDARDEFGPVFRAVAGSAEDLDQFGTRRDRVLFTTIVERLREFVEVAIEGLELDDGEHDQLMEAADSAQWRIAVDDETNNTALESVIEEKI